MLLKSYLMLSSTEIVVAFVAAAVVVAYVNDKNAV